MGKSWKDKPAGGRICIGVATRRRPAMLEQCLRSLAAQAVPAGTELVIVVVENDREEFSKGIVGTVERQSSIPIEYHLERNIGISNARNTVLDAAIANGSDYLAFIDDDELAYPQWIRRLFTAMTEHDAMIAGGPVNRIFQCKEPPVWATRYFRPKQSRQGGWPNVMPGVLPMGTNNLLFDLSPVRQGGVRFDQKFNLIGTGDLAFIDAFSKAVDGKSVYVNDALVCEVIPESRLKLSYIFMDAMSSRTHAVRMQKQSAPGIRFVMGCVFKGISNVVLGGLIGASTYFFSKYIGTIFLIRMAKGIGTLLGLAGYHPLKYKKVTGN